MTIQSRSEAALVLTGIGAAILGVIALALMFTVRGGIFLMLAGVVLLLLAAGCLVGLLVVRSVRR